MSESNERPAQNTDREIWREREGDYYADSIHVTQDGGIGLNCGGYVIVMPIRAWHALAKPTSKPKFPPASSPSPETGERGDPPIIDVRALIRNDAVCLAIGKGSWQSRLSCELPFGHEGPHAAITSQKPEDRIEWPTEEHTSP